MLLRQSRTLLRHCCWCGPGIMQLFRDADQSNRLANACSISVCLCMLWPGRSQPDIRPSVHLTSTQTLQQLRCGWSVGFRSSSWDIVWPPSDVTAWRSWAAWPAPPAGMKDSDSGGCRCSWAADARAAAVPVTSTAPNSSAARNQFPLCNCARAARTVPAVVHQMPWNKAVDATERWRCTDARYVNVPCRFIVSLYASYSACIVAGQTEILKSFFSAYNSVPTVYARTLSDLRICIVIASLCLLCAVIC